MKALPMQSQVQKLQVLIQRSYGSRDRENNIHKLTAIQILEYTLLKFVEKCRTL